MILDYWDQPWMPGKGIAFFGTSCEEIITDFYMAKIIYKMECQGERANPKYQKMKFINLWLNSKMYEYYNYFTTEYQMI